MTLSQTALMDVDCWCKHIVNCSAPVNRPHPSVTLTTGAALIGWGLNLMEMLQVDIGPVVNCNIVIITLTI